jgi:hypothetical protein
LSHRAHVYTVRVSKFREPEEHSKFGDFDGDGNYLGAAFQYIFSQGFAAENEKDKREVVCEDAELIEDDLRLSFQHGESGYASRFVKGEETVFNQRTDHTQLMPCYSMFHLPENQDLGYWAVHLNNKRSGKSLILPELKRRFRVEFPDWSIQVEPCVKAKAFEAALANDQVQSVKLIKYDRSSDFKDARKWMREDMHAQIELRISPLERGKRLASDLLRKAVDGNDRAFGEVVEFEGMHFDQARVQVKLDGGLRTYELGGGQSGHPFPAIIDPTETASGPVADSVFAELKSVIAEAE